MESPILKLPESWRLIVIAIFCCSLSSNLEAQLIRLSFDDLGLHGHFGKKFDIHDNVIVVAEPNFSNPPRTHTGRLHVFHANADDWVHDGLIEYDDAGSYTHFGHDISVDENILAASAPGLGTGSVFIYHWVVNEWVEMQQLTMPTEVYKESPHCRFGENIELHGEWLAVTAPGYRGGDNETIHTSAVFLFRNSETGWVFHQIINSPKTDASIQFGNDMVLAGNYLLISAVKGDGGADASGVVYLYRFDSEKWVPDYTFINPDSRPHELFGADVAMHENTIVIGVPMHTKIDSEGPMGAVHVFQQVNDTWVRTALIEAEDGKRNDMFGYALAVENGHIVIAAPRHDQPGKPDVGKVYHYVLDQGFWSEKTSFIPLPGDIQPHMQFGSHLSISHDQLVMGGHLMDNALEDSGIAYTTKLETITSTEDAADLPASLFLYPNPVQDVLHIRMKTGISSPMKISMYAENGTIVFRSNIQSTIDGDAYTVDVSMLMPGMYFLHADDGNHISILKWVKI